MIKALKEYQVQDAKLREIEKVLSGSEERKKTVSAKKYLEAGYKVDKSDMLVLANLAYVCKNLGEIEESRNYYKILEQSSDPTYSNMAKQRLADFEWIKKN